MFLSKVLVNLCKTIHYIVEDFINGMIKESKFCTEIMEKSFNKELVMTKKIKEDFQKSTKSWIWDHFYAEPNVQITNHCRITGKYRGSAHEGCYINMKSNHKISIIFLNLMNYDSHRITQELGKFNFKIHVIPN